MSTVNNVILSFRNTEEHEAIVDKINEHLCEKSPLAGVFKNRLGGNDNIGGSKYLEATWYVGAFNYLHMEELEQFVETQIEFKHPEDFQILSQNQEESKLSIWQLDSVRMQDHQNVPKDKKTQDEWFNYFMKTDPVMSIWLESGVNEENLRLALLAKCLEFDRERMKLYT